MLFEEMAGENRLHRVLGPVSLSALGVGAIIGTGIFVMVGKVTGGSGAALTAIKVGQTLSARVCVSRSSAMQLRSACDRASLTTSPSGSVHAPAWS